MARRDGPSFASRSSWALPVRTAHRLGPLAGAVLAVSSLLAAGPVASATPAPSGPQPATLSLVVDGISPASVSLRWSPTSDLVFSEYDVYRSTAGSSGPWVALGNVTNQSTPRYYWQGLPPGSASYFQVRENGLLGQGGATRALLVTQPAVASLSTAYVGNGSVALGWNDPTTYGGAVTSSVSQIALFGPNGSVNQTGAVPTANDGATLKGFNAAGNLTFVLWSTTDCRGAPDCARFPEGSTVASLPATVTLPGALHASVSGPTAPVAPGATVAFGCTSHGGVGPYAFGWRFDDGSAAAGRNVSHAFPSGGSYVVSCRITDSLGEVASSSLQLTVVNSTANPGGTGGSGGGGGTSGGSGTGGGSHGTTPPTAAPVSGSTGFGAARVDPTVMVAALTALGVVAVLAGLAIFIRRSRDPRSDPASPPIPPPPPDGPAAPSESLDPATLGAPNGPTDDDLDRWLDGIDARNARWER